MKDFIIGFTLTVFSVGLLVGVGIRESTANPDFASYGCVENVNCHK